MANRPGKIHQLLAEILQEHPEGLTSGQLREKTGLGPTEQAQLDRRRRDLKTWYHIEKRMRAREVVYVFKGVRDVPLQAEAVNWRRRASALGRAHGRCQMCGRTVADHGVVLVVDHKIPRDWGGLNEDENLWAICEECNAGKKAHFASQDQELMRAVMSHKSVHMRIGELLKLNLGKPVSSGTIEFVANQEDWQKRTRELRYLGWEIDVSRESLPTGRVQSLYTLKQFPDWPADPSGWIRRYEQERAKKSA